MRRARKMLWALLTSAVPHPQCATNSHASTQTTLSNSTGEVCLDFLNAYVPDCAVVVANGHCRCTATHAADPLLVLTTSHCCRSCECCTPLFEPDRPPPSPPKYPSPLPSPPPLQNVSSVVTNTSNCFTQMENTSLWPTATPLVGTEYDAQVACVNAAHCEAITSTMPSELHSWMMVQKGPIDGSIAGHTPSSGARSYVRAGDEAYQLANGCRMTTHPRAPPPPPSTPSPCVDLHSFSECALHVGGGTCHSPSAIANCAVTCGACSDGCVDRDYLFRSTEWYGSHTASCKVEGLALCFETGLGTDKTCLRTYVGSYCPVSCGCCDSLYRPALPPSASPPAKSELMLTISKTSGMEKDLAWNTSTYLYITGSLAAPGDLIGWEKNGSMLGDCSSKEGVAFLEDDYRLVVALDGGADGTPDAKFHLCHAPFSTPTNFTKYPLVILKTVHTPPSAPPHPPSHPHPQPPPSPPVCRDQPVLGLNHGSLEVVQTLSQFGCEAAARSICFDHATGEHQPEACNDATMQFCEWSCGCCERVCFDDMVGAQMSGYSYILNHTVSIDETVYQGCEAYRMEGKFEDVVCSDWPFERMPAILRFCPASAGCCRTPPPITPPGPPLPPSAPPPPVSPCANTPSVDCSAISSRCTCDFNVNYAIVKHCSRTCGCCPAPLTTVPTPPPPPSPQITTPSPLTPFSTGWYIGFGGHSCTEVCFQHGLVCDQIQFHFHLDDVDSRDEMMSIAMATGVHLNCTNVFFRSLGVMAATPEFRAPGECLYSLGTHKRPIATLSCSNPATSILHQRVCFCNNEAAPHPPSHPPLRPPPRPPPSVPQILAPPPPTNNKDEIVFVNAVDNTPPSPSPAPPAPPTHPSPPLAACGECDNMCKCGVCLDVVSFGMCVSHQYEWRSRLEDGSHCNHTLVEIEAGKTCPSNNECGTSMNVNNRCAMSQSQYVAVYIREDCDCTSMLQRNPPSPTPTNSSVAPPPPAAPSSDEDEVVIWGLTLSIGASVVVFSLLCFGFQLPTFDKAVSLTSTANSRKLGAFPIEKTYRLKAESKPLPDALNWLKVDEEKLSAMHTT